MVNLHLIDNKFKYLLLYPNIVKRAFLKISLTSLRSLRDHKKSNNPYFENTALWHALDHQATCHILFFSGDFGPLLEMVNEELEKSKKFAGNDKERSMLTLYIDSFKLGSLEAHKVIIFVSSH